MLFTIHIRLSIWQLCWSGLKYLHKLLVLHTNVVVSLGCMWRLIIWCFIVLMLWRCGMVWWDGWGLVL